jgi:hypothetical protein
MHCPECGFEMVWDCTIKDYETNDKVCPNCNTGKLEQDYNKKTVSVDIKGYSYNNHYGLKK